VLAQIYRAAVKLMGDMSEVHTKLNSEIMSQAAAHWSFGITKDTSQLYLIFRDGTRLGLLNAHTAKALDSITNLPSVQLDALVDLVALRETMCRATKASDATIRVNINVYGTREARKEVGDQLSRGKVYLQHPDQKRGASIYDNPHVLQLPGMNTSNQNLKPDGVVESASKADKAEQFKSAVSNVYASLKRSSHLKRMAGDNRLRTPLLP
jgi:SWI/SNF-related matrix-associated actin-dependent regulator of chromatin subfamily A3